MEKGSTIVRQISSIEVLQRETDGYVNATQLLKAHKARTGETRKLANWLLTERAEGYIAMVEAEVGIPTSELVEQRHGSRSGSWIHPDLAVPFATWLSVEFEFQVSRWVQDWMRTGGNPIVPPPLTEAEIIARLLPSQPLDWECRFGPEFWTQLERLYGYRQGNVACALWLNKHVYNYYPQPVRDRLDEINPLFEGRRKVTQHQFFRGKLEESLDTHLVIVFALMEAAATKKEFERLMVGKFAGAHQFELWGAK